MHMLTRTLGVLAASAAMTVAALPAQAVGESVSVADRIGEISLVEDAVPIGKSPLGAVGRDGTVRLGSGASAVDLELPVAGSSRVERRDGRYVVRGVDGSSLAVAPTAAGTQILVGVESSTAPTDYAFDLGGSTDLSPRITPGGGVEVVDSGGRTTAQIAAPWAIDANGRHVPTRFELKDGSITQVVDHRAGDFAYPIVADPKVKFCDWKTAACVKFTKTETRKIRDAMFVSLGAGVGTLCGKIPNARAAGMAVRGVCAAAVAGYFYKLRGVFNKAKKQKKCVELKFRLVAVAVVGGKVVKC